MSDTELNRITRWGIPGWVATLSVFVFLIIDIASTPRGGLKLTFGPLPDLLASIPQSPTAIASLVVAIAGVPLGFVIYQAYFFLRWNSPFSRDGLLPPYTSGRAQDVDRALSGLSTYDLTQGAPWRSDWLRHPLSAIDHTWKWRYVELLFGEAAQKLDARFPPASTYARHRALLELMHTLGASTAGLYCGFITYFVLKALLQPISFVVYALTALVLLAIPLALLDAEDYARKRLEQDKPETHPSPDTSLLALTVLDLRLPRGKRLRLALLHPAVGFIIFLAFLHLFNNPFIEVLAGKTQALVSRAILAAALIVLWGLSKRRSTWPVAIGETLFGLLSLGIAAAPAVFSLPLHLPVDWPFLTVLLVFLTANVIFLKNRQNTRDDIICLEHYTLRRYLTEQQHLSP